MSDITLEQPPTPTAGRRHDHHATRLLWFVLKRLGTAVFVLLCTRDRGLLPGAGSPAIPSSSCCRRMPQPHRRARSAPPSASTARCSHQYVDFIGGLSRLDFGNSLVYNQPVSRILADRLPATIELAAAALVVTLVVAIRRASSPRCAVGEAPTTP